MGGLLRGTILPHFLRTKLLGIRVEHSENPTDSEHVRE